MNEFTLNHASSICIFLFGLKPEDDWSWGGRFFAAMCWTLLPSLSTAPTNCSIPHSRFKQEIKLWKCLYRTSKCSRFCPVLGSFMVMTWARLLPTRHFVPSTFPDFIKSNNPTEGWAINSTSFSFFNFIIWIHSFFNNTRPIDVEPPMSLSNFMCRLFQEMINMKRKKKVKLKTDLYEALSFWFYSSVAKSLY